MFTRFSKLGVIVGAVGLLATATAFASPMQLELTSGTQSTGILMYSASGCAAGVVVCQPNGLQYSNLNFNGWTIYVAGGASNSPTLSPFGIDINSLTATCNSGNCGSDNLVISISDTGFTTNPLPGTVGLSLTSSSTGKVTQQAYGLSSNGYFDMSNPLGGLQTVSGDGSSFESTGMTDVAAPYSLTLVDTLWAGSGNSYSTDGRITQTPEPGALAMFGAGLLGCALFINRRRRASRQS